MAAILLSLCACAGTRQESGEIVNEGQTLTEKIGKEETEMSRPAFRVGMASADITPTRAVYLEGYEAHDESSFAEPDKFTSDLQARVIVVDNGTDRLVFINVEQVFSGWRFGSHTMSENLVERAAKICGTSTDNVLLSNTHSHQSYMTLDEEQEKNIADAVKHAYDSLAPAAIGIGTYCTAFGASRDGNYTMDLTKPYDSQMNVIRFDNAETGEPIGLIYSVPMHNTLFGNGPGLKERHNLLSCEFTGYTSRKIEETVGVETGGFVAMHINGFYGNATGIAKGKYYAEDQEELIEMGGLFAKEILNVYNEIETEERFGDITTAFVDTSVPCNKSDTAYMKQFGNYTDMPLGITLGAFGDIAFIGVNYEPFSIIGARLKAESPYGTLLPAANVNGWKGYIPTKETVEAHKSAYEAECAPTKTPFDEAAEEVFYEEAMNALCSLAGVTMERTEASSNNCKLVGKGALYTFDFADAPTLSKLVISFAQTARTDCASKFELMVYDEVGNLILKKDYEEYSVNYIGVPLDGRKVAGVELIVEERYMNGAEGIDLLPAEIYGVTFTAK